MAANAPHLVIFNSGFVHHVGPGRLAVDIARRVAGLGISTLRFDFCGIGDSAAHATSLDSIASGIADAREAMDRLSATHGARTFVVLGLCSGARYAHHVALADPRVVGAVMFDGYAFSTVRSRAMEVRERLEEPRALLTGAYRRARLLIDGRAAPAAAPSVFSREGFFPEDISRAQMASDLQTLAERGVAMLNIYSGEWKTYTYEGQLQGAFPEVRLAPVLTERLIESADHLYFTPGERATMLQTLTSWLRQRFVQVSSSPAPTARPSDAAAQPLAPKLVGASMARRAEGGAVALSKREHAARILSAPGLGRLMAWLGRWDGLLVLNYHRVGHAAESMGDDALFSATPEAFDAQIQSLVANSDLIGHDDLDSVLEGKRRGRFVHITFDDGYQDNFTEALPVLRRHGVGASFFVTTSFLDDRGASWWDQIAWMVKGSVREAIAPNQFFSERLLLGEPAQGAAIRFLLQIYKGLPSAAGPSFLEFLADATGSGRCPEGSGDSTWMTWDMVRQAAAAGMGIGGHTVTHPILARLSREEQEWQVGHCGARLEQELGRPMTLFSYPIGGRTSFNADTHAALARSGVQYAFSYYGGYQSTQQWNRYDIKRVAIEAALSPDSFESLFRFPQLFAS
ncbi:MAG TPA: polysaccharide deacetylase family protein [Polyangia bacterium]|nr:polysaccharide deacetylase family protein [Polyangia bacterium]